MVNYDQKREKFKRLASQRTNNVLKAIQVLGNCSNRSTYSYTQDEVNKVFLEIERKLKETKSQFKISSRTNGEFRL